MLRQALDAAAAAAQGEAQQQQQQEEQARDPEVPESETSSLVTGTRDSTDYGSATKMADLESESVGTDDSFEDASYQSSESLEPHPNPVQRAWNAIRAGARVIADVDDLWDSPNPHESRPAKSIFVVMFWFTLLACAYAVERSTFKLLVDRVGPFRLFSVEVVTVTHGLFIGLGMIISAMVRKKEILGLGVPLVDIGLMALLDTVHLLLAFIAGSHVPPTETVILVQLMIPLTAFFTQFVHPDGFCRINGHESEPEDEQQGRHRPPTTRRGCGGLSTEHIVGSVVITAAVALAMCPAFISYFDPAMFVNADAVPMRTAYNTILFALSSVPAAASQLYKEHTFLRHKQPVDSSLLNLILSVFQFCFAMVISPLVYVLQGLGPQDNWQHFYPSSGISKNFVDGLKCFFGILDEETALNSYREEASCDFSLLIAIVHVLSIIVVGVSVDKIVVAGATKILYRGISAGIILAVIAMYIYDLHDPDFNYGPAIDSLHFACTLMLILGSEVYHRVSLQDATFETVYPEVENLYDDD